MKNVNKQEIFAEYPDVLTVDELIRMMRIGRNNAYDLLRSGKIRSFKVGKHYRITKKDAISYLESI